jgi:outer membrane receptor protein involved in Fe transport
MTRSRARSVAFPLSLIAALACALPSRGRAQSWGAVNGSVTEPDGRPIGGVLVSVQGLGISVATNATGRYVLTRVPAGPQRLQFRRMGYAPHELTVTVTAGIPTTADAVLEPQPIELGTVLVEGVSRAPDHVIDAPAAVDVMRPAPGEPASITGQVPLALAQVPGLDVAQSSVTDFNVNARGFNTALSRKMLVLQDGRDLGNGQVGTQIWGALSEPLEDLGRIEVIRGPGSAMYGANAYNGVISITTPAARDVVGTKYTLGGGGLGTERADLRQAGVWLHDRFGYRVNLGYTRSDEWTRSRTAKDGSDWKQEYVLATATVPTTPGPEKLALIGQTTDSVTGQALGAPDPLVTVYGSGRIDYYAAKGTVVTLEGGTAQADNSVFLTPSGRNQSPRILRPWARLAWDADGSSVSAWYSGLSSTVLALATGARSPDHESVFHLEGRTSRTFHGNASRVMVGASVQDNRVNTQGTALRSVSDDRSDRYYGAFAQFEYGARHVRLIGAVRWDDSDLFSTRLSPRGAIVFTPTTHHALRLTVDRGFLTPGLPSLFDAHRSGPGQHDLTAIEAKIRSDTALAPALASVGSGKLFDSSAAVPQFSFGNPHLVPQTVTSYEVGYKGQFGRRVFITLDAYDAHIEHFLTGPLPAGTARVNPDFQPWTAPPEVPVASRAEVAAAVLGALASRGAIVENGLTRLADGTTAVVLSFGNVGTVDEWGVELGSSVALTVALIFRASYTWYNFAIRQNLAVNVLVPNTPQHRGTVALAYTGPQGITLGVDTRLVTRYHWRSGVWIGDVPASQMVNLNAGCRVSPHLRVYADVTDVFDQQRFQLYGGAVIGRRLLAGVTSTF